MTETSRPENPTSDAHNPDAAPTPDPSNLDLASLARATRGFLCQLARQISRTWIEVQAPPPNVADSGEYDT